MNEAQIREKILKILQNHKLTVISTVDENHRPESAVVAFAEDEALGLVFGTSNLSRKYANLRKNPRVSFVIGWSNETGSVQYEGVARELSNEESLEPSQRMAVKNEKAAKFMAREDQRYFQVTPTWLRLVDTSPETNGNYELIP